MLRVGTSLEKEETADSNVDDEKSSSTKMRFRKIVMLLVLYNMNLVAIDTFEEVKGLSE